VKNKKATTEPAPSVDGVWMQWQLCLEGLPGIGRPSTDRGSDLA